MGFNIGNSKIYIDHNNLISYGKNGNVYRLKNKAIKILSDKSNQLIDKETCEKLSNISTTSILLPRKIVYYNDEFCGYTLKFVKEKMPLDCISNLERDKFIYFLKILEDDVMLLSKKGVLLDGVVPNNVIIGDKIYITDPSKYIFLNNSCTGNGLINFNNYQIHLLISKLVLSSLKKKDITSNELKKIRNVLLDKSDNIFSSTFFNNLIGKEKNVQCYVKKITSENYNALR